jgi:hypothetical protein
VKELPREKTHHRGTENTKKLCVLCVYVVKGVDQYFVCPSYGLVTMICPDIAG